MRRLFGQVALITGAARGQGRSHALKLASEGADIIAVDIGRQLDEVPYEMSSEDDLAQTVAEVEALDRRIVSRVADVRDLEALQLVVDEGVSELGRLDIVSVNAGIVTIAPAAQLTDRTWRDMIDINLTGAWNTARASIPALRAGGRGGSIVFTSSGLGLKGKANVAHYSASKHGLVGLMRSLALELAADGIRVNSIHPTHVATPMVLNAATYRLFRPDLDEPTLEDALAAFTSTHVMQVPWVEPIDVSNALLFLVSEDARYITGITLPVDAGSNLL